MAVKASKTTITVRLEDDVYSELVRISKDEIRSINNLIEYALTKFVHHYQPRQDFQSEQHFETRP